MFFSPKRKAKFFKFLKIAHLPYMPFILGIETGNICNLKCPLCPTGAADDSMVKGFMKLELFKEIIEQLKNSIISINLYSWGEPLLNPDLVSMVEYTKKLRDDIKIITSTNLNIRDDRLLSDLIKSEIDEIIISCDGATEENYSKYRVGGDFDLVLNNMKYLVSLNARTDRKTSLIWNFLVFKHNEHEIEKARSLASSLGVIFRVGKMRTSMKDEILKPHGESIEKDKDWIPNQPEYSAYDKDKLITKKIITTCRKPWQEISINWDGKVFPCCAIYDDKYNYGNIKDNPIKNIWNNTLYNTARKEILGKSTSTNTICGICKSNGFMHF